MRGQIKTLNERRFGFIRDTAEIDWFFHQEDLVGIAWQDLSINQEMEFEGRQTVRGFRASSVKPQEVGSDGRP